MMHSRSILDRETSKPEKLGRTLGRFAAYFRKYWFGFALVMVFIFVSATATVMAPNLLGQAFDCYVTPNPQSLDACWYTTPDLNATGDARLSGLLEIAALMLGVYVLDAIMVGLAFYTMRWTGQNVLRTLRADLMRHIHRLSLGFYSRQEAGNVMSRVTNDMDTVQQMFNFALLNVIRSLITILFIIGAMAALNLPYALISLAMVPVMLLVTRYFSSQARKAFRRARKEIGSVNADLQESIAGAREVQAFNREEESIAQFQQRNQANREANVRAAVFTSALNPVLEALGFVSLAIIAVVGGLSALNNQPLLGTEVVTLGLIFAFIRYIQRLNQPITQIAILWTNVQSGIAGGERIFGLLDEQIDLTDKPDAVELPSIKGHIVYDDVRMHYKEDEPVLRGVSFEATPGQTVAIVGPTGAGKTTIINLLPRFFDVTGGSVQIDGYDVRDVTLSSLRSQIGIVLQDTFLFSTTIMDNIRYGRLNATDEEVREAARMVGADAFIERLPDGYDTVLGERGGGLSQGQRQLIAIARAALMQPNVLILDEATSSVDTRTERVIQAAFEKLLEGRTSFVIAHRLSTIRNADQVMMLVDGQVIERGTHNELMAQEGAYYDLYMSQFQAQEEPGTNGTARAEGSPVAGD